jgi:hypothetical protein
MKRRGAIVARSYRWEFDETDDGNVIVLQIRTTDTPIPVVINHMTIPRALVLEMISAFSGDDANAIRLANAQRLGAVMALNRIVQRIDEQLDDLGDD